MTKDQLPERLRNIPGLEIADGKKRVVTLSESQTNALIDIFLPVLEREEKGA